jgi:propanol-preferring alcohol dehydrogenase
MKAMILREIVDLTKNEHPLELVDMADPIPGDKDIIIKVSVCGVCHTELDEIEGRTPPPNLPVILGHQVIGTVASRGKQANRFQVGERVGVAWIFSACGTCQHCLEGNENLCRNFTATGRDHHGGYAEYMSISESFAFSIPSIFTNFEAAPLLCAGAIGYRSLKLTGLKDGQNIGLTGFGASGHLVLKIIRHRYPQSDIFVFARSDKEREFALELGAVWAGDTAELPPQALDSVIDTTPVWKPVVEALKNLKPGGRLVINAIRKEEVDKPYLLKLDYPAHLWLEREIKSVANVTRRDVSEFLELAAEIPIKPAVEVYGLEEANRALLELKQGKIRGAKILKI